MIGRTAPSFFRSGIAGFSEGQPRILPNAVSPASLFGLLSFAQSPNQPITRSPGHPIGEVVPRYFCRLILLSHKLEEPWGVFWGMQLPICQVTKCDRTQKYNNALLWRFITELGEGSRNGGKARRNSSKRESHQP